MNLCKGSLAAERITTRDTLVFDLGRVSESLLILVLHLRPLIWGRSPGVPRGRYGVVVESLAALSLSSHTGVPAYRRRLRRRRTRGRWEETSGWVWHALACRSLRWSKVAPTGVSYTSDTSTSLCNIFFRRRPGNNLVKSDFVVISHSTFSTKKDTYNHVRVPGRRVDRVAFTSLLQSKYQRDLLSVGSCFESGPASQGASPPPGRRTEGEVADGEPHLWVGVGPGVRNGLSPDRTSGSPRVRETPGRETVGRTVEVSSCTPRVRQGVGRRGE